MERVISSSLREREERHNTSERVEEKLGYLHTREDCDMACDTLSTCTTSGKVAWGFPLFTCRSKGNTPSLTDTRHAH